MPESGSARSFGNTRLSLIKGDITRQQVAAIVNAANPALAGGGGVDGAIHRAAGPLLASACREIINLQGSCPTGTAVITPAGDLPCRFVIHTVGPVWKGGSSGEAALLAASYRNSLILAAGHAIESLAFPSISTGVYGYPVDQAAPLALHTVRAFLEAGNGHSLKNVVFVLFNDSSFAAFHQALAALP